MPKHTSTGYMVDNKNTHKEEKEMGVNDKKMHKVMPHKAGMEVAKEKYYPSIHLSSEDLPALKDWEVGKTYSLHLEVKQKSKNEESDKKISASFDILKIGIMKNA